MAAELLNIMLGFQPDSPELQQKREYDKAARDFVTGLASIHSANFLKGADTPQDILAVLDPTANSIAYAITLRIRIAHALDKKNIDQLKPGNSLWNKLVLFLESFDPVQMRYAGAEWKKLVDYVETIARGMGALALAIAPIRSAMLRLDPTTGTFTSTHLKFIRLCLESRSYATAVPILDNYIHSLPSGIPGHVREGLEYSVPCADTAASGEFISVKSGHTDKISVADVQEYYVLGATAYMGVRQFKEAQQFLEHVLIVPAAGVGSGLMLEAYKRWVLLSCLVNKSWKLIPRTANGNAIKSIKGASKAYEALAEAFGELNNLPKLKAQVNAGREIWAEDGNTGLVNELVAHQNRSYVSRLSRTFSAIPISNIASNVGGSVDEMTTFVETLIRDGLLNGRIEQSSKPDVGAVLRFYLDPTQGPLAKTEKQQQQALFQQTERTNMLAEQVKDADYRLSISKEYVEYVKRQNRKAAAAGGGVVGGGADAMDVTWGGGDVEDEDIMGDLS